MTFKLNIGLPSVLDAIPVTAGWGWAGRDFFGGRGPVGGAEPEGSRPGPADGK
jgi:hypothetical protein